MNFTSKHRFAIRLPRTITPFFFFVFLAACLPVFVAHATTTASNPHCITGSAAADTTAGVVPQDVFVPDIKFPGLFGTEVIDDNLMGKYFRALFVYMVYAVGALSVVMVTFGGVKWVAAAGNAGRIADAKDTVTNSIIGLVIALTTYLLLSIINPALLGLALPGTTAVNSTYFLGAHVIGICGTSDVGNSYLQCGQVIKIGQETCPGGKIYETYCISTNCDSKNKVCGLRQNPTTLFFTPGAGCIQGNIQVGHLNGGTVEPITDGGRKGFPTMQLDGSDSCGYPNSDYHLGSGCKTTSSGPWATGCYMMGNTVNFPQAQITISGGIPSSHSDNMACPRSTTYIPGYQGAVATKVCSQKVQNALLPRITTCGELGTEADGSLCIMTGCENTYANVCSIHRDDVTGYFSSGAGCVLDRITARHTSGVDVQVSTAAGDKIDTMQLDRGATKCATVMDNYHLGTECSPLGSADFCYVLNLPTTKPIAAFSSMSISPGTRASNMGCPG